MKTEKRNNKMYKRIKKMDGDENNEVYSVAQYNKGIWLKVV